MSETGSEKPQSTTISDTEAERIQALPALSTYLPIMFKNGATVQGLALNCSVCGRELGPENIRADVEITDIKATLKAYGVCLPCRTLTPIEVRLRDDGSLLSKVGGSWSESRYIQERPTGAWAWMKIILSKLVIK